MGLGIACGNLVFYYYQDISGVNKNRTKARMLLQKGCESQDIHRCYQLELWEMQGLGRVRKDSKSPRAYLQACGSDIKANCKTLAKLGENSQHTYKCEVNVENIARSACLIAGESRSTA